ncbi:antibiotic biosynthesis monooxygenase [Streptomyces sp. NPDC048636]|uniref:antibiotic biosynthesis monooxygenase n=1 Tax=Streptomyces sp. NPDC048636 TaxID=3155762 RepID=UPI0034267D74
MKACLVAFHYPRPSHREEFIGRVHRVAEVFRDSPGCLSAECWVNEDAVVSTVRCESAEALDSALSAVMAKAEADIVFDEREARPREVFQLMSP